MTTKTPTRQCAGCGARRPQAELWRLTADAGAVVVDVNRRLEGRGTYLCPGQECADRARRKGSIARRLHHRIEDYGGLERWLGVERAATGMEGMR